MTSPLPFLIAMAIVLVVIVAQILANVFIALDQAAAF